jgi:hypothetical protein
MAAGLGYIEFATGDILTAAAANGYLASQTVMVFADAAARTAAITSPQEGMFSYLKDSNSTQYYSGSAWVSIGGASPLTTKGDLYTYSTTDARLAVGTNGQTLVADSTAATGLKWAASSSGALTLITRQAYTSAGTINVDNVFSSTYDNYKIVIKNSAGNIPGLSMRLRVSSADNTTSNYNSTNIEAVSGTTNAFGRYVTSGTSFMNTAIAFTGTSFITFDITSPNLTETTSYAGLNGQEDGGFRSGTFSGLFDATTSFTGFSLYGASGTATGVVTVYGYQKS